MANELKDLRVSRKIPAKDIVAVVQRLYPSFDKTMLSKCENCDKYGVTLKRNAINALIDEFAPDMRGILKRRRSGGHRLSNRITCRMEKVAYSQLQQAITASGYDTMQDWLSEIVNQYIKGHSELEAEVPERSK